MLTADDRSVGARSVAVIGCDVWTDRFAADPEIVGRDVRIGGTTVTVVGVMPDGFAFPVAHDVWMPFPDEGAGHRPLEGPSVRVLARRSDASMDDVC